MTLVVDIASVVAHLIRSSWCEWFPLSSLKHLCPLLISGGCGLRASKLAIERLFFLCCLFFDQKFSSWFHTTAPDTHRERERNSKKGKKAPGSIFFVLFSSFFFFYYYYVCCLRRAVAIDSRNRLIDIWTKKKIDINDNSTAKFLLWVDMFQWFLVILLCQRSKSFCNT